MGEPSRSHGGFTLVELLIVISLLSLVLLTGMFSYSFFSQRWAKELSDYHTTTAFTRDVEIVRQVLQSSFPMVVEHQNKRALFWLGQADNVTATSLNGFFYAGAVIYRLQVEEAEGGKQQLVYLEQPLSQHRFQPLDKPPQFVYRRVLFEDVINTSFRYYGWASTDQRNRASIGEQGLSPQWFSDYRSHLRGFFPQQVTISVQYRQAGQPNPLSITWSSYLFSNIQRGLNHD